MATYSMNRHLFNRLATRYWEYRFGINTRQGHSSDESDYIFYASVPYRSLFRVLNRMELRPDDVFVDIGCGRGRVLCVAGRYYKTHEIIGIEYYPELARAARENVTIACPHQRPPVRVLNERAEDYKYSEGTAFYMYHPFGAETLGRVLLEIKAELDQKPRPIRIAYVNPVHESLLENTPWLQRYDTLHDKKLQKLWGFPPTSFWRSIK